MQSFKDVVGEAGIVGALVLLGMLGLYRLTWAVGPHLRKWLDDLVANWIQNQHAKTAVYEKLVNGLVEVERRLAQHGAEDEARHGRLVTHVDQAMSSSRHELRNYMQVMQGGLIDAVRTDGKYTRTIIRGGSISQEDTQLTPPKKDV